ncbi:ankyrin repeat domain-containing protein [Burkholderia contaminans]|uniref:ankyrin repeat domain-containing protein n=1 Tax=Burkholderia contaminans TaxID=488447 RepID=UPI00158A1B58|nr:ankyrin repeat domain-containing protein [Burkholderia contaminans]
MATEVSETLRQMRELRWSAEQKLSKFENDTAFESEELFFIMGFINDENIDGLRHLQEMGYDFTKQKSFPLIYAAHEGKLEAVKYFVEEVGLSVRADGEKSFTYASMAGHTEVAQYLMAHQLSQDTLALGLLESSANGNLELVDHLTTNVKFTEAQIDYAFEGACINEQKEVALYLYANYSDKQELKPVAETWAKWTEEPTYKIDNVISDLEHTREVKRAMDKLFNMKYSEAVAIADASQPEEKKKSKLKM